MYKVIFISPAGEELGREDIEALELTEAVDKSKEMFLGKSYKDSELMYIIDTDCGDTTVCVAYSTGKLVVARSPGFEKTLYV